MNRRGFTLIEIMVVVVILGVVATVVVANIGEKPGVARAKLTATQIKQLRAEVELFKADHSRFPESLQDLVQRPAYVRPEAWPSDGYRSELPVDAWGRPFHYRSPGVRGPFDIVSYGEDGKPEGEGVNADLWSHPPKP